MLPSLQGSDIGGNVLSILSVSSMTVGIDISLSVIEVGGAIEAVLSGDGGIG